MIVFLRTRKKHTPARDTEINAILRGVVTPLATAGAFVSVKHVHSGGTIKFAYVQESNVALPPLPFQFAR